MKTYKKRILSVFLSLIFVFGSAVYTVALSNSEKNQLYKDIDVLQQESKKIQTEINQLKSKKNSQGAVLEAIRKKIANTQAQIDRCNREIASINAKISANKAEMDKKNKEIEADKEKFKKRIRTIRMSDSGSTVKILLGAGSFASFLELSQLTASVAASDKKIVTDLKKDIDELNRKNEENDKLLESQVAIKNQIAEKQAELNSQEDDAASIYNGIAKEEKQTQSEKNAVDAQIRAKQKALEDAIRGASYEAFINPNTHMQWPVSGFRMITAGFKSNDSVHKGNHNGIDISGGNIAGQPILAIADGIVTTAYNGCSHNYKKSGNCCGNGYGNYCVVNHGTISGSNYVAYYAHAQRIIVSPGQQVKQGQTLGYVGTTGWSTGYHLHLGILRNNAWINPAILF